MIILGGKIVGVKIGTKQVQPTKTRRPQALAGRTYQLKTPLAESSVYITINDVILDEGEPNERRKPFEIFISAKAMENFQWIVALTRLVSAIFRTEGDILFVVDELKSVFDPRGGYLSKNGHVPSLVAEIGLIIEQHFKHIGIIKHDDSITAQVEEKKKKHVEAGGSVKGSDCPKCSAPTLVLMDNCPVCLTCGYSKCG